MWPAIGSEGDAASLAEGARHDQRVGADARHCRRGDLGDDVIVAEKLGQREGKPATIGCWTIKTSGETPSGVSARSSEVEIVTGSASSTGVP